MIIALLWLGVITIARWQWELSLIFLWLGGLVGVFLVDLDHWLYLLVAQPQELTSLRVKKLLVEKKYKEALVLVADTREERTRLSLHNALTQLALVAFGFFVLTSTQNLFGSGLVLGVGLHLLKDEVQDLLAGKDEHLRQWLWWPIKINLSWDQQRYFVIVMLLVFLGSNLLLI